MKTKCNKCRRQIKDTPEAKIRHIVNFHPDIFLMRAFNALFNPKTAFNVGLQLGSVFKQQVNKMYGAFGKNH